MKLITSVAAVGAQLLLGLCVESVDAAKPFHCPPLGQTLSAPRNPSSHRVVSEAVQKVTELFRGYVSGYNNSAASLTIKSLHEDAPLLDIHHTPETRDQKSTTNVTSKTVYRVGSVSKLFAPLAILREASVDINDPVTKYLPELRNLQDQQEEVNELTTISWDDVTLLSLANHMGGFAYEMAQDIANFGVEEAALGLPVLDKDSIPGCSGFGGSTPCTKEDFLAKYGKHRPAWAPFTTPMYSNAGFPILSFVVEQVTNTTFTSHIQNTILDPLGMGGTSPGKKPEDDSVGFIPAEDPWWSFDLGVYNPAGGFYSNTEDLIKFGEAILNHELLSGVETRKWMKPTEHTSSLGMSVGAPWEIVRIKNLTSDGRVIDLYTKSGDVGPYHSIFALIPDYDIVLTFLTGGPEASVDGVFLGTAKLMEALIPALDQAAKAEAGEKFVGQYADEETNSTITLSVDDGPGLAVSNWVSRGVNVVENYGKYLGGGEAVEIDAPLSIRLYTSGLSVDKQSGWRAVFYIGNAEDFAAVDASIPFIPQTSCQTWFMFERVSYGFNSIDDFVVALGDDGTAEKVTSRFFRTSMALVSRDSQENTAN